MNKPGPMQWVADPPEVWAGVIDVLVQKIIDLEHDQSPLGGCPSWPGQNACPLKTDGIEKCWGEAACWVYWAYMLTVMKMATENAKKPTGFQVDAP